jgi:hypothetical protein
MRAGTEFFFLPEPQKLIDFWTLHLISAQGQELKPQPHYFFFNPEAAINYLPEAQRTSNLKGK